jgi:hypothetical protein
MRNQFNNGLKRPKRFPNGNIKKEPLLALVLCAGGQRQVANGDGQEGLIGQVLQLLPTAELLDTHRRGMINFG